MVETMCTSSLRFISLPRFRAIARNLKKYWNVYFTNNANVTLESENNVYLDTDVEVQSGVKLNIE